MKRFYVLFFLLSVSAGLFAQEEKKIAFGIGPEWNMNARQNFAMGGAASFDFNIGRTFAAGVNMTTSDNFSGIMVLEPAVYFRDFFLNRRNGRGQVGLFLQAELGAYLIYENNEWRTPMFLGGLRGGYRFPLGMFYVEPYGRIGYPFAFGIGAIAGMRF